MWKFLRQGAPADLSDLLGLEFADYGLVQTGVPEDILWTEFYGSSR